jgi:hypothetical protein
MEENRRRDHPKKKKKKKKNPSKMSNIFANKQAMLQTAMVCTVILYLKTHFCFIAIGGAKTKAGKRAPEDT